MKLWPIFVLFTAVTFLTPAASPAQPVQRIVAIVNNDVVSQHYLDNRINLFIATANVADTPESRQQLAPQVLETLINDRLKGQEIRRLNITVSQDELDEALTQIAKELRVPPQDLKTAIERRGAQLATLIDQVETEIAWMKAVQRSAGSRLSVSEDEVDELLARMMEAPSGPEYRVAEIFLPVETAAADAAVQAQAQRLIEELRRGATFPTLARTFSQGPTAQAGGDLGWVRRGQLVAEMDRYLDDLDRGEMVGPLRSADGYRLMLLIDKREGGDRGDARLLLTLLQVFAPLPPQPAGAEAAAAADALRRLVSGTSSCAEVQQRNNSAATPLSTNTSDVLLRDLPPELRPLVLPLQQGEAAGPFQVANGLLMLVVCDRRDERASAETRAAARQRLLQERLAEAAQRLLRELKRNALIELRQ
jgi:peptidyl-prolyl cis-trans isomerase SurA